jgi:hypothetical protein
MVDDERELFESVVHELRSRGWSRVEAEGEALERIEKRRADTAPTPGDSA